MRRRMDCALNLVTIAACLCLHALVVVSADSGAHSDEITLEWKQIFVNVLSGPSFSLMVEPEETGVDLRWDIYEIEGIPEGTIIPMVGETVVDFSNRLSDYDIIDQTVLTVDTHNNQSSKTIEFYVRTLDGRDLQVTTELGNSVASLKDNITQWTGIPQRDQRLLCNGKELKDERKLLHYEIKANTTLNMGRPLGECRQAGTIFVKTLSGATIEVEVNLVDTVTDLKERIWEKAGIPANVQRLSVPERMINGLDHLCDLGLEAGSTVYMYLYSARITNSDQVAKLQEPHTAYPVNNYKVPIFREVEDDSESVQNGRHAFASLYKDARNWVARTGHRPYFADDLFDQVAHLSPNPDYDESIKSYLVTIEEYSRPDATEKARVVAKLLRARLKLTMAVRPYREAANLTSANYTKRSHGITLGGGSTHGGHHKELPLGADVNNWVPDAFTDSDVMRLFEVAERVRQVLARAAQTGEGILSVASQRRINRAILFTHLGALTDYPPSVEYKQARDDDECGICRDNLTTEPALKLACEHVFHTDCITHWASNLIQAYRIASCPFCRQGFTLSYESLGKAELETPELQGHLG